MRKKPQQKQSLPTQEQEEEEEEDEEEDEEEQDLTSEKHRKTEAVGQVRKKRVIRLVCMSHKIVLFFCSAFDFDFFSVVI